MTDINLDNMDTAKSPNGQSRFLEFLKSMDNQNLSMPKELAEVLSMSLESVYRRLRGEVDFTLNEVMKIADRFEISLDLIMGQQKGTFATVQYNQMYNKNSVFVTYLGNVNALLNRVHTEGGNVTYICNNMPLSCGFRDLPLREFKVFYWQKVVLNRDRLKGIRFSKDFHLTDPVNNSIDVMLNHYDRIDSVEIWNENSVDSTVRQIEYCRRMGLFDDDGSYEMICKSALDSLNDLEIKLGKPEAQEKLRFYICSIELASNAVLINLQDRFYTFLNFSIFNSVSTTNTGLGSEVQLWYECLLNKSTRISGESDLIRRDFFNNMRAKINKLL